MSVMKTFHQNGNQGIWGQLWLCCEHLIWPQGNRLHLLGFSLSPVKNSKSPRGSLNVPAGKFKTGLPDHESSSSSTLSYLKRLIMNGGDRSGVKFGRPTLFGLQAVNQMRISSSILTHVLVSHHLHQHPQQLFKRPSSELINKSQKAFPKRERTLSTWQVETEARQLKLPSVVTDSFSDPETVTSLWPTHLQDTVVERGIRIRPLQFKQSMILIYLYKFQMLPLDIGAHWGGWRLAHKAC